MYCVDKRDSKWFLAFSVIVGVVITHPFCSREGGAAALDGLRSFLAKTISYRGDCRRNGS